MSTGVYEIPLITESLLEIILRELETGRKIAVTIKNESSVTLENPKVYFSSGTSQFGLPSPPLYSGKGLVWGARKSEYVTRGTAGVIVYHIKDYNLSLAFMWSVPLVYLFYTNWWNLKIYEGFIEPDEEFFWKMYYDYPHKGDGNPYSGTLSRWSYEGSMGDAGQSTITITFREGKA
ncbi:17704_t:CDS:2 [Acaulospora morrowiae]|uniref:17704_t:CDS:1 n=1 Tax=Acaulospora morrowiae TaxID=94023 RepID=A0A9N9IFC3_9GLOM|nr:17704_t:CDS:2 [Acaulospora morrowiae]